MLAPIRDYLYPRDPKLSPLLCSTKDHYFTRLSVDLHTSSPRSKETQWIASEDVNVEHLLNFFTSVDTGACAWDACINFMHHLHSQKPRQTVLRSKIEGLPDDHPSKAKCLFVLSRLFGSIGNKAEQRQILARTLELGRQQGDDFLVAQTLRFLSRTGTPGEGISHAKEALEMFERLGNTLEQAKCMGALAWLLLHDNQLDAAEEIALREIDLLKGKDEGFWLYRTHCLVGQICRSKGDKDKAIHHFKMALEIASPFNWRGAPFWTCYHLAELFCDEHEFGNANAYIERARSYAGENTYKLVRGMYMQARIWYRQGRLEEARSEVQRALEIHEELEAAEGVGECETLLREIDEAVGSQLSAKPDPGGELPSLDTSHTCINSAPP